MFDAWSDLDDTTLLVTVGLELRAERRATAAKVIAAGTFLHCRLAAATPASGLWAVDDVGAAAAELAAELGISRFRIQPLMELGVQLRDRFPTVTERFLAGDLDLRVVRAIHDRTLLLNEPDLVTQVDRHCADHAAAWNHLSDQRLTDVLDWLVVQLDPMATRRRRARRDHRYVHVLPSFEGACQLDGELPALDGARLDARLDAVAATVCHRDDRTRDQRRADALMALVDGHHHLTCTCGTPDCPAAGEADTRPATSVTVYVLAEHATLTGDADTPAYLPGHGPVPADTVRDLAQTGNATVRPLPAAAELDTEQSYRPSRRLAAYLFCRDLTCRFPACDRPAQHCDLDHTIPWPAGATHPSNTKAYCRFHHLLKTFWTGPTGWTDTQHPDGRVTFTSPTGRTYTTTPLGAWFFPQLATPTNTTPATTTPAPPGRDHCTTRMPLRRRTRTAERTTRHTRERATNEAIADANPPPF